MEESIKDRLILILGILSVIFFVGTISNCSGVSRLKHSRDKEMSKRLDLEEEMAKIAQKDAAIEKRVNDLNQELDQEKANCMAAKKALTQEQLANQNLKDELEKITQLKEKLEDNLKEALVKKSDKSRR